MSHVSTVLFKVINGRLSDYSKKFQGTVYRRSNAGLARIARLWLQNVLDISGSKAAGSCAEDRKIALSMLASSISRGHTTLSIAPFHGNYSCTSMG